jgi:putative PIN family toxin of toxin-antitoxin system
VVLDTNVLILGILFKKGSEAKILRSAEEGHIVLCISLEILTEFVNVLSRPKFRLTDKEIQAVTEYVLSFARIREPTSTAEVSVRDPEDLKFLECAKDARAHFLVTGDKDLLAVGRYGYTQILTPAKFLYLTRNSSYS